jgi:hypothetical protein
MLSPGFSLMTVDAAGKAEDKTSWQRIKRHKRYVMLLSDMESPEVNAAIFPY